MMRALLLAALACSACSYVSPEGAPGEPGPAGPRGPRGPAGLDARADLELYAVQGDAPAPKEAQAWCEPGDGATGGGCTYGAQPDGVALAHGSRPLVDDDGAPVGWACTAEGDGETVVAYAVCLAMP